MNSFDISVIIPTRDRSESLKKVLNSFADQSYPCGKFEVIVIDDGSLDDTESSVKGLQNNIPFKLSYLKQDKSGPAAARNKGINLAQSQMLLFTGDDTLPTSDFIAQHLKFHRRFPDVAVLGFTDWSKESEITDFMRYIAPNGLQFRYESIKNSHDCDFCHFYTSNISLSKKWFIDERFDEAFKFATLEDTELAYRLKKKGLRIIFNKKAINYHSHQVTLESFCQRMELTGLSAVIFIQKHPKLKSKLLPVNISFARVAARILKKMSFLKKINLKLYWLSRITTCYIEGLDKGYSKQERYFHKR